MTLYGVDVSNHQGNFNFGAAKAEGFSFATHKITEGNSYKDPYWPRALEQMREHFPGRFGGYHFWRRGDANRQADLLLAHIGDPTVPIQLDFEDTDAAKNVSLDEMFGIIRAIEDRGMRVSRTTYRAGTGMRGCTPRISLGRRRSGTPTTARTARATRRRSTPATVTVGGARSVWSLLRSISFRSAAMSPASSGST
ncbi:hypothetical protein BJF84_21365 [Rhodococcus sp. CUA-806]|nr:hypothetical protein BJF84_21365 [Rhodococcus sp. CUA-806]